MRKIKFIFLYLLILNVFLCFESLNFSLAQGISLQPYAADTAVNKNQGVSIFFQKENPTKYVVKVKNADRPFWLVLNERFNAQWKLYLCREDKDICVDDKNGVFKYPELRVTEAAGKMRFILADVFLLFKKPLILSHQQVNGYANGWYVDPEALGQGSSFCVTVIFWPQILIYLGTLVTLTVVLVSICVLTKEFLTRKS